MTVLFIRHPADYPPPSPWQTGWGRPASDLLADLFDPVIAIARAPQGTPLPDGAEVYVPESVRPEDRKRAREHLEEKRDSARDSFSQEVLEHLMEDEEALDDGIRAARGEPHWVAEWAPFRYESLDAAVQDITDLKLAWDSSHTCGVIRTAPKGFQCWQGVGGRLLELGGVESVEEAEGRIIQAVRKTRENTLEELSALHDWPPDTPVLDSTLGGLVHGNPIHIRRGPMSAAEYGSSWDLPVVAVVSGDEVSRYPEKVTWDDEQSRARWLERCREGEERRRREQDAALAVFRNDLRLREMVRDDGLVPRRELSLRSGYTVSTMGPVRMSEDNARPQALVHDGRQPVWMDVLYFM